MDESAMNLEELQVAIQKAIDNGDEVSRAQVIREVQAIREQLAERDKLLQAYKKDFKDMRDHYEKATKRWQDAESKLQEIIDDKASHQHEERIKADALKLCAGISNFLERYGGYAYLGYELSGMNKIERTGIEQGTKALYEWVNTMMNTTVVEVVE